MGDLSANRRCAAHAGQAGQGPVSSVRLGGGLDGSGTTSKEAAGPEDRQKKDWRPSRGWRRERTRQREKMTRELGTRAHYVKGCGPMLFHW